MNVVSQLIPLRPRERLLQFGVQHLSDAELLALFFSSGLPGLSAVQVCAALIGGFGSLRKLLAADRRSLMQRRAVGAARYTKIQAALEIARRVRQEPLRQAAVARDSDSLQAFLLAHLRDFPYEVLCCLYLDGSRRLIACENAFRGTVDRVHAHPREIVRRALHLEAAGVITARNQPYGNVELTSLDRQQAERLGRALMAIDAELIDHIVVGDGTFSSLEDDRRSVEGETGEACTDPEPAQLSFAIMNSAARPAARLRRPPSSPPHGERTLR